jgi:putative ABC transport system ATP-binding protein
MSALTIQDLAFAYPGDSFRLAVPSLTVAAGSTLALAGASGGGKTTLLRLMTGLLTPERGEVRLGDRSLNFMSREERRAFRLQYIGLVFQDFALLDYLTVEENILIPHHFSGTTLAIARANLPALLDRLQIDRYRHHRVSQLSQGERQRVAIARALAHEPPFLFADEPTASLDPARTQIVSELLIEEAKRRQAALVVVTHDHALLPRFDATQRMDDFSGS